jgi:hypothetical protein
LVAERNIVIVHYKKETKSFQIDENLTVQAILTQAAEHYRIDVANTSLVDQSGQELSLSSKVIEATTKTTTTCDAALCCCRIDAVAYS